MRSAHATWRPAAVASGLALVLAGCGLTHLSDLNFRVDKRLHFVSPEARATVRQPVTVTWTIRDFQIVRPGSEPPSHRAGYFGVFVDRTPIKPGDSLRSLGHGDPACESNPKCPDLDYLHARDVYPTTATSLRLPELANLRGRDKLQMHTVIVVLLDTSGRRIGESAWELDVRVRRIGS